MFMWFMCMIWKMDCIVWIFTVLISIRWKKIGSLGFSMIRCSVVALTHSFFLLASVGMQWWHFIRDVPFRVAQLTTFEVTKSIYLQAKRSAATTADADSISLSAFEAAICGAAAGSFSAAITNPLDRIKTLMMTDTTNAYGGSVVACASKIVKDEGLRGLFAGVVPRVAYIAPSVCIFFVTYELAQQRFNKSDWVYVEWGVW